jgi:poly(3-hydroxybutyrate) depolymerase
MHTIMNNYLFLVICAYSITVGTDLNRLLSHSEPVNDVPYPTRSHHITMPGFQCSETETQDGEVSVYYPSALDDTYPIVSFLHGSGGGSFSALCNTIASYGMVVVAVHQGTCGDWSMQQVWSVLGAKLNQQLSPAFPHVNYDVVAIAGHSQGAAFTMGTASKFYEKLNIVAAVASHGQSENAAPNMPQNMAFMFNAGTSDPKTHKLWWTYQDVKSRPKVFYNLHGASHMEPTHEGYSNEFMALFLGCHTTKRPEFCAKIYEDGPDSMCHKYPADCDIEGADFTTTASPNTECRCLNPGNMEGENGFKCTNGEEWNCSSGQICYATEPFSYDKWEDGCTNPAPLMLAVPSSPRTVEGGLYEVASQGITMPGFQCSERETHDGWVTVYYPTPLDGTYPIVSFLHGSGGSSFAKLCYTIASYGMVVVAVHQGTCGDLSMQQRWAVQGAQQHQDLSPAFAHVDFGVVGLAGHSMGAAYTMGTAAYQNLNVVAAVASHGQSANAAPNMPENMAFMFNAGTSDPKTHKLWWAYQDVKSRPKVFYNLYGAAHMEPTGSGHSNEFMALFLACHMIKKPEFCAKIYGDGPDSMRHKYPASVDIQGADFTTTASPNTECRCTNPGSKQGELKCTNGETWHCSSGQICYSNEPFSYGKWGDGCASPAPGGDRIPVPNGGACDWGLPAESQNCDFCSKYYDPRYGNNDNGKCVWVESQNHCMPKQWAQQQHWDIQEFCNNYMCSCTSPCDKADNGMKCTNGESRSCGDGQICYSSEPFHYGEWDKGCAQPSMESTPKLIPSVAVEE